MATGDQTNFLNRIKSVLPGGWFPDDASFLDGVVSGAASCFAWLYSLIAYANLQARIATATDIFLDVIGLDYLGATVTRRAGESDAVFSARIRKEIIRPRGTRASLISTLTDLTGRAPTIFEPADAADTGGIGHLGMTAGTGLAIAGSGSAGAGGWGSLALPFQAFVVAFRARGGGIPSVAGYYIGSGWAGGGIGSLSNPSAAGAIEIGDLAMSQGQITDAEIDATITNTIPVGTIAWTVITN